MIVYFGTSVHLKIAVSSCLCNPFKILHNHMSEITVTNVSGWHAVTYLTSDHPESSFLG